MEIEPGTVVASRYRVLRQLGRGGMGEVFAAENVRTGRTVAVKVLRADSKQKASAVERFRREARAAGAISSDYVTQVLDVEDDAEHGIVIVFELLEGESLIDRLKRMGPMSLDELYPFVEQVWMGLADAHKSGVIHRDLKPSNVFLEKRPDGGVRVKILDFGISKIPKEVGGETLTEMGQSLGTFSFMPPEQIGKAKTVDHRADIYACATLIYQAMSGQLPYAAKNILQMVDLKTKSEPRPLSSVLDGQVDPRLEAFLVKGLMRDPNQRFQTAAEALEAWRALRRPSAPAPAPLNRSEAPTGVPRSAPTMAASPQGMSSQQSGQAPAPQPGSSFASPSSVAQGPYAQAPSALSASMGRAPSGPLPGSRAPATVMMADPRSHNASPLASQHAYPPSPPAPTSGGMVGQGAVAQAPVRTAGKMGGTVAMTSSSSSSGFPAVAYAGAAAPTGGPSPGSASNTAPAQGGQGIHVPVVNDTTSEGSGDQIQTIAMPVRGIAQGKPQSQIAASPSGIPRIHDDASERGQMGTQLMSHAALRQAGANIPQRSGPSGSQPRPMPPGVLDRPSSGTSGTFQSVSQPIQAVTSSSSSDSGVPSQTEGGDLTTVYRREKQEQPPQAVPPAPVSKRTSRAGIVIGILAFAIVGFLIAAVVLRYLQTHQLPWQ